MPDFLSRLVERTFNLVTVAQPVIGSIFSPESSVRNGYRVHETNAYDSVRESESLSDQNNVHIDNSQKTGIIPKRDDQPTFNWENTFVDDNIKPFDLIEDLDKKTDEESGFNSTKVESSMIGSISSMFRPTHIFESPDRNNLVFPEQIESEIESVTLHKLNDRNDRYLHPLPAELALDAESLHLIDSDILESVESETIQAKNQNNQSIQTSIPKPIFFEEQSQSPEIISQKQAKSKLSGPVPERIESEIESVTLHKMNDRNNRYLSPLPAELAFDADSHSLIDSDILESVESETIQAKNQNNQSIQTSIPKPIFFEEQSQSPEIISLKQAKSKLSGPVSVQRNRNIHSWQNKPFVDKAEVNPAGKILPEYISNSSLTSGNQPKLENDGLRLKNDESILKDNKQVEWADSHSSDHLHSDTLLPTSPTLQNSQQVSTPKVNAIQGQLGNLLIKQQEKHAFVPVSPTAVPTIKVTIGRIEVKAIKSPLESSTLAPQPQTPSPPRQHPLLSLDDYLKQHNG